MFKHRQEIKFSRKYFFNVIRVNGKSYIYEDIRHPLDKKKSGTLLVFDIYNFFVSVIFAAGWNSSTFIEVDIFVLCFDF